MLLKTMASTLFSFFRDFIYLFLDRGIGREKERKRNINVWLLVVCPPLGLGLQPRRVPWLGIKPVTLWFTGWCSIHWATPARAQFYFLSLTSYIDFFSWNPEDFFSLYFWIHLVYWNLFWCLPFWVNSLWNKDSLFSR